MLFVSGTLKGGAKFKDSTNDKISIIVSNVMLLTTLVSFLYTFVLIPANYLYVRSGFLMIIIIIITIVIVI